MAHVKKPMIVVSAINLRSGGPLTILRDCLKYLSESSVASHYDIVALVHKKELCEYPHVEYIEFPKACRHWISRLYYEYFYFRKLSERLNPRLWLSLHDMTPRVRAERRAVYMHNPSIVNKIKWSDFRFDKTYILFALFYKYLYRINIKKNAYCIVQQRWFKEACSKKIGISPERFIIARPNVEIEEKYPAPIHDRCRTFFFPAFPRPFKNFETICRACEILERSGVDDFEVTLTMDASNGAYSQWICRKYAHLKTVRFVGLLDKKQMNEQYEKTDCLIFPSRLETWGLPISEFIPFNRPMIIADEPYAHETAEGGKQVAFFSSNGASKLAALIKDACQGDYRNFREVERRTLEYPFAENYEQLFRILLDNEK